MALRDIIAAAGRTFGGPPFSFNQRVFIVSRALDRIAREVPAPPTLNSLQSQLSRAGLGLPSNVFMGLVRRTREKFQEEKRRKEEPPPLPPPPKPPTPPFNKPISANYIGVAKIEVLLDTGETKELFVSQLFDIQPTPDEVMKTLSEKVFNLSGDSARFVEENVEAFTSPLTFVGIFSNPV